MSDKKHETLKLNQFHKSKNLFLLPLRKEYTKTH